MRIDLIQPRFSPHIDIILAPLNLGYIASYLKSKGINDVFIHSALIEKDIFKKLKGADLIGVSVNTAVLKHAIFITNKIKNRKPKTIIVWGGSYPSALPDKVLENQNIDYVVRGEGEVGFYELVKAVENNEDIEGIRGISYRKNGEIIHNRDRELIKDLDTIPFPDRELMAQEKFLDIWSNTQGERSAMMVSSRGCPYQCIHCSSSCVWTRRWRARTPENIIKEIKNLIDKYNIDVIGFGDSVFSLDKSRVKKFCNLLKKEKLEISWWCQDNINNLDRELLLVMKDSGCRGIAVGVESGSEKILRELRKGISLSQVKDIFRIAKEIDFNLSANFMIGSPSEDYNTIKESEALYDEIEPDNCGLSIVIPFPGSEFYNIAKEKGYLDEEIDWSKARYDKALVPTKNLSRDEINREYRRLYKKMYTLKLGSINFWHLFRKGMIEFIRTPVSEYGFLLFKIGRYLKLIFRRKLIKK